MFGINAAPFFAQFVSQHHARQWKESYPRAAEAILQSTFMDDTMDSVENVTEGSVLYKSLSELWKKAGMSTHKWLSNSPAELRDIPPLHRTCKLELSESNLPSMKIFSVMWVANEDVFTFSSKLSDLENKPTKQSVLKRIASFV